MSSSSSLPTTSSPDSSGRSSPMSDSSGCCLKKVGYFLLDRGIAVVRLLGAATMSAVHFAIAALFTVAVIPLFFESTRKFIKLEAARSVWNLCMIPLTLGQVAYIIDMNPALGGSDHQLHLGDYCCPSEKALRLHRAGALRPFFPLRLCFFPLKPQNEAIRNDLLQGLLIEEEQNRKYAEDERAHQETEAAQLEKLAKQREEREQAAVTRNQELEEAYQQRNSRSTSPPTSEGS